MNQIGLTLPPDVIEAIARRAADLVEQRDARPEGFLDVAGAAEFLACPASRVYALTSAGRLPVHRDGTRLLFRAAELDEWVRAGGARRP